KKRTAVDKLLPTLRATKDPVTRDIYVGRLAEISGVSAETLVREMRERPPRGSGSPGDSHGEDGPPAWDDAPPPTEEPVADQPRREPWTPQRRWRGRPRGPEWAATNAPLRASRTAEVRFERDLLRLMLVHRPYIERVLAEYGPEAWRDGVAAAVVATLREIGPDATMEELAEALEPDAVELAQQLVQESAAVSDAEDTFGWGIVQFRLRELEERKSERLRSMGATEGDEKDAHLREITELSNEITALKKSGWAAYERMRS
ncbi:MAG: hypothetical protein HY275_07425, partial [Gemmatimonadetes bacterium]|nr:hypothetical protein [Gemmatimonadota bacterium]